jgi:crotonobetainyl-CoA:carnitine CoA-transferase CaiB-like acyl-CoA transferase
VLEMTRVVAAPTGTRLLSALGAEVLRIDPLGGDEFTVFGISDLVLGKRWATLDIKTEAGLTQLRDLIATCDVFVSSQRADALDRLGLSVAERAALRPGLVDVEMNAYGWTGPWWNKRGFDSLVQFASGIADEVSKWANQSPATRLPLNALGHLVDGSRPRHLPVEALDFSTGYQVAAAAIAGLARRVRTGAGSSTRLSLARTAQFLMEHELPKAAGDFTLPWSGELLSDGVYELNGVPVRRSAFPISIAANPLRWDRPSEAPGASAAVWSTAGGR